MKKLVPTVLVSRFTQATPWLSIALAAGLASLMTTPRLNADTTVFSDDMNYADNTEIQAAWSNGLGAPSEVFTQLSFAPTPLSALTPTPASGTVMGLNNGIRYRSLDSTVTQDWTLSFLVLQSSYQRGQGVYLLDSTGSEGYGVIFDGSTVNSYSGEGFLKIMKFDNSTYTDWGSFGIGTQLVVGIESGHPVLGYAVTAAPDADQNNASYDTGNWQDMLEVTLTWESATGTLTAYAGGVESISTTDTDFSNFDRIYLRGNTKGYFDNLQVTVVPESSATGWVLGGICLGLAGVATWKRRRR